MFFPLLWQTGSMDEEDLRKDYTTLNSAFIVLIITSVILIVIGNAWLNQTPITSSTSEAEILIASRKRGRSDETKPKVIAKLSLLAFARLLLLILVPTND